MDYPVELYEAIHRGSPGDAAHYRRVCAGAAAVLELGAGYGRLMPDVLAVAERYVGLERDAEFAKCARARLTRAPPAVSRRGRVIDGDMTQFSLSDRFDRVLIPHSGLFCLPSRAAVQRCFECVARHLTEDGELWGDTYHADPLHEAGTEATPEAWLTATSIRGRLYQVFEQSTWSPADRWVRVCYRYASADAPDRHAAIEHHYLLSGELSELLQRAGLRLVEAWGDFRGGPLDEESEFFVFRAVIA